MTGRAAETGRHQRRHDRVRRVLTSSVPARLVDLRVLPGQRDYRRFIVLGSPRTGSNMLLSALAQHPSIRAMGEVFGETDEMVAPFAMTSRGRRALVRRRDDDPLGFLDQVIFRAAPRRVRAAGFKIFYHHCWQEKWKCTWNHLAAMKDLHVIHLRRRNLLRALASFRLAERTDRWADYGGGAPGEGATRVELTVDECQAYFAQTRQRAEAYEARFTHQPILALDYETLVAATAESLDRIQDFLGVPRQGLTPQTRRQNPRRLDEMIENARDLQAAFAGTPDAAFFEDEPNAAPGDRVPT